MRVRLPDAEMFAYPTTQTRHGICYLSLKPGGHPPESDTILTVYLTRGIYEQTRPTFRGVLPLTGAMAKGPNGPRRRSPRCCREILNFESIAPDIFKVVSGNFRPGIPLNSPCWETVAQWIGGAGRRDTLELLFQI